MTADTPWPIGYITLANGQPLPVFECAVCLCLTANLPGHRQHMEHGR